ncbi:hypothetical protein Tco_0952105 [Tanacetum coccineum]|uniref:Uncharacterized protein n=1 Tax=Tanacetum coccineum TaxID=301880 RepID=A0ABQ5DWF5_9ASTR
MVSLVEKIFESLDKSTVKACMFEKTPNPFDSSWVRITVKECFKNKNVPSGSYGFINFGDVGIVARARKASVLFEVANQYPEGVRGEKK